MMVGLMANPTTEPTTMLEKIDRCGHLSHRPRILLGKMGLDGHDRGVKLIARALRDSGVHVIYSGLWQTPKSLAIAARDEDVDCIAASMMSNSHNVLVPNLVASCRELGCGDIRINVGGIIPKEDVQAILDGGVHQVFHTGTGMLEIVDAVADAVKPYEPAGSESTAQSQLARAISLCCEDRAVDHPQKRPARIIGLTGSPGAGKSTLVAAMANELHARNEKLAVIAFDPMSPITSGALLGDRLRVDFNTVGESVFYRSVAVVGEDYRHLSDILGLVGGAGYDRVIVETVGSGQSDVAIRDFVDSTVVVVVPGMGDAVQMDKAGILEIADTFVVNKADFAGEAKLVRELLDISTGRPIYETIATRGQGIEELVQHLFPSIS